MTAPGQGTGSYCPSGRVNAPLGQVKLPCRAHVPFGEAAGLAVLRFFWHNLTAKVFDKPAKDGLELGLWHNEVAVEFQTRWNGTLAVNSRATLEAHADGGP